MSSKLSLNNINIIKKKNILLIIELYNNRNISFLIYNKWIKIVNEFPKDQYIIYNNLLNYKNNKINEFSCKYEPNFIILVTGQSNAGGWGSSYDINNINDQPNENIYGYDISNSIWKIANLNDSSLGDTKEKIPGTNLFAFHFAKHLIKKFPGLKPGIINVCSGGKPIANWALYNKTDNYYKYNKEKANIVNIEQGYFFNQHKVIYEKAISQLSNSSNKINVVLWHQGESDNILHSNTNYYNDALTKVIKQYTILNNNLYTPFVAGTILDHYIENRNSDLINNIIRKMKIKNNCYNFAELSKLKCNDDKLHFTSESHRIAGKLYFDSYIKILEQFK